MSFNTDRRHTVPTKYRNKINVLMRIIKCTIDFGYYFCYFYTLYLRKNG